VLLGPTAVGKTSLSVSLAKKYNGEIISADSRQVYKGLDIGTEKITKREMRGIPHHLLDVASPKRTFSVTRYKELAEKAIREIAKRGKLPVVVGGTGFYIDAVVYNQIFPEIPPNPKLRSDLEKKSVEELLKTLKKLDLKRSKTIEQKNKRRLIRAIEIATSLGHVPLLDTHIQKYNTLVIGLTLPDKELKNRIDKRLVGATKKGLITETKKLRASGVSWKRIQELGLEYRTAGEYIRDEINHEDMIKKMQMEIWKYAKRQKRWFKRNKDIKWFSPNAVRKIEKEIKSFLNNS